MPAIDSLKLLFELDSALYTLQGQESVRYGEGLHTKHKHIRYHDFFIQRIGPGSNVLDVGCGNGALAHDIATHIEGGAVYGIDILPANIEYARQHYSMNQICFVCGDALSASALPDKEFDVIVLSNVLEHLEKRVDFLRELQKRYHPRKYLIRVPLYERDWRVPLKEELGMDYRLDSTHFIEYRQNEFFQEINEADLRIEYSQVNWGEIWTEIVSMDV
ncbi:hypothetical protein CSA56_19010 [candidate division KSB3 bacterium]|uniref:Methyltransferase type 11 domain-containing protein n=1 Tax=candidate division KSB3 bacterium TaxID=2044937 RepID=A0A2G6K6A0_9BACT|nr:MAG: hypothetical protein CSA56_19010 [candidate division KSB3 bacterium]